MWSPKRQEAPTKIIGPAYTVKYVWKTREREPKPEGHYVSSAIQSRLFEAGAAVLPD